MLSKSNAESLNKFGLIGVAEPDQKSAKSRKVQIHKSDHLYLTLIRHLSQMMIWFNHIFLDPNIEPGTICRVPIVFSRIQTTPALKKIHMGRVWNKIYCEMNCWSNTIWNNRLICRNLYNNLEEYTWSVPMSSTAYIQVGGEFWNIYSVFFRPLALIKHSEHRDSSAKYF